MRTQMLLWFLLLGGVLPPIAPAQNATSAAKPCSQAESKQFDFWLGEWTASWPASGGQPTGTGHNSIKKTLDDCVVEESFSGLESSPLRGMSVSMFNPATNKWQQTWVDNQGSYLDFVGEFDGKQMVLSREATNKQGQKVWQRMVWKNITPDAFDWSWESSKDGKEWQVNWPIRYQRVKR